ncbi:MAG: hypothetical protein IKI29_05740 [Clostridia bacterium]|nr:hypothetical protein [Clostridia bacterium]
MVKGVNKTVIEVNETGSKLFEKIVFYVTPQYGSLSAKRLKKAAGEFTFSFDNSEKCKSLRSCIRTKRIKQIAFFSFLGILLVGTVLTAILFR